ncbi:MAG: methyltransferase [Candidatus Zixiibacteriota bacterium]
MKSSFIIALVIFVACNAIRFIYELLKKDGKINPQSTPLFIFILLVMCILWLSWFAMCPQDPLRLILPDNIRWIGLGIFIAGLILAFGALIQLRGVENINHLETQWLFSKLRHPMYLGFIFWILGWVIFYGAVLSFFAGLICIGNIIYWRYLEEEHLAGIYGDKYLTYRKQTWF